MFIQLQYLKKNIILLLLFLFLSSSSVCYGTVSSLESDIYDDISQDPLFQEMIAQAEEVARTDAALKVAREKYEEADEWAKTLERIFKYPHEYDWNISVNGMLKYSDWLKQRIGVVRVADEAERQEHIDAYMEYLDDAGSLNDYLRAVSKTRVYAGIKP